MQQTIAAVILAGGEGRRLGGADKALLPLAGRPLLAHVLARLQPQAAHILLSANGDPGRFREFGMPVVADRFTDQGPLAGIAAGALTSKDRWPDVTHLLTVPVDTPLLPMDLVAQLSAQAAIFPGKAIVAQSGKRMHWAVALWPVDGAAALDGPVNHGGMRRLRDGLDTIGWHPVAFAEEAAFANINTQAAYEKITRSLIEN